MVPKITPTTPHRLLLDMVYHNPGDIPFVTRFSNPGELASLGYTGQVCKNLNTALDFDTILPGLFPANSAEREWLDEQAKAKDAELQAAMRAGIEILYHTDLFVLPKLVVEKLRGEICDPVTGRIDALRPRTMELHRELLAALFARYPGIGGLMIRVGETYLFDTPHHAGNTAVPLHDPAVGREAQIERFVALLQFLREEICVRHNKKLIHRTWDYFTDRFHADPEFYLAVTDAIEPHPHLIFSIKHTGSDFFRASHANKCLGIGRHPQIVEVQCQREYEGKGAIPCYIARGVVDGFDEHPQKTGLRHWSATPQYAGLFTWTRGGGWFGPYLRDEFWPELNARVLAAWHASPDTDEATLFEQVCANAYGLDSQSQSALRELSILSEDVILHGRYCLAAAEIEGFRYEATNLWMRDDRLGGIGQLADTFAALEASGRLDEAVEEKRHAAELAARMPGIAAGITFADPARTAFVRWSAEYAANLFAWVAEGWQIMVARWRSGMGNPMTSPPDLASYEAARARVLEMTSAPNAWATGFTGEYWNWPGMPPTSGMDDAVANPWTPPNTSAEREDWQPQKAKP